MSGLRELAQAYLSATTADERWRASLAIGDAVGVVRSAVGPMLSTAILAALDAERAAGRAESRWQPIETAPTAERGLVWGPKWAAPAVGWWDGFGWMTAYGGGYASGEITHWQQLPEAP